MSLDVYLHRFIGSKDLLPLLSAVGKEIQAARIRTCGEKSAYKATVEETHQYTSELRKLWASEEYSILFLKDFREPVRVPSIHPFAIDGKIGCWRVSYSSTDISKNLALSIVYEAFPEAHPNIAGPVLPNWQSAWDIMTTQLTKLKTVSNAGLERDIKTLEVVLETIGHVLANPPQDSYFFYWSP